jgi:putative Ca2+/H+ antiporter (TMEM165/GDT1 family)
VFGYAATIIPRVYTYYISTLLFALFGLKMLRDGYYMSSTEGQEELEEVQSDLRKRDDEVNLGFLSFHYIRKKIIQKIMNYINFYIIT